MQSHHLTAISLFSGAGGMDFGLEQSGIKTLASVEIDRHCAATLRRNDANLVVNEDIRTLEPHDILSATGRNSIDIVHGGPPCQPFSQIGARKGLGHKDGMLIFEMMRWIEALKPRAFVIEQVKGLLKHEAVVDELLSRARKIGYTVDAKILNSVAFDVPQARERVIFAGLNMGSFDLDGIDDTPGAIRTVGEALAGLSKPGTGAIDNHIDRTPDRDRERISWVKEGEWLSKSNAPADIIMRLTRKDTTKFRRLHRQRPSLTLRCGEIFYHPIDDRYLTPREYMRIHGYPDSFVLEGPIRGRTGQVSNLDQHRQIANSVPPPLARAVGAYIGERLACL